MLKDNKTLFTKEENEAYDKAMEESYTQLQGLGIDVIDEMRSLQLKMFLLVYVSFQSLLFHLEHHRSNDCKLVLLLHMATSYKGLSIIVLYLLVS